MDFVYIILAAGLSERFKSKDNSIEKQFYLINKNVWQDHLVSLGFA